MKYKTIHTFKCFVCCRNGNFLIRFLCSRFIIIAAVKTGLISSFYAVCSHACLQFCNFLNGAYCLFKSNLCIATWIQLMGASNLLSHFRFLFLFIFPRDKCVRCSHLLICQMLRTRTHFVHVLFWLFFTLIKTDDVDNDYADADADANTFTKILVWIWWNSKVLHLIYTC